MAQLHSILHYIILPWLYFTLLDSALLYRGSTSLYFTLRYRTLTLYTLHYSTLPYHGTTSLYFTLHYLTMALLHSTLLYIIVT